MVASLLQPVELIRIQRQGSAAFKCAVAEMQGWRASHEDAHAVRCNSQTAELWVLDGHRGDAAARFGATALLEEIGPATKKGSLVSDKQIQQGFEIVDHDLRGYLQHNAPEGSRNAGSTVVGALIMLQKDGSYSAKLVNCGDSRAVVFRGLAETHASAEAITVKLPHQLEKFGQNACWADDASWLPSWPAIVETIDHKPGQSTERSRIEAAGGKVCGGRHARVDGNLAVSRGLGDFDFKNDKGRAAGEQKVICIPDMYEVSGLKSGTLLLLACDGLWDVMTSEEAASFVRARLRRDPEADLGNIAAALIRFCLRMESGDNMTVLLAHFIDGADWADAKDELLGFEKMFGNKTGIPSEDTQKHYEDFMHRMGCTDHCNSLIEILDESCAAI